MARCICEARYWKDNDRNLISGGRGAEIVIRHDDCRVVLNTSKPPCPHMETLECRTLLRAISIDLDKHDQ